MHLKYDKNKWFVHRFLHDSMVFNVIGKLTDANSAGWRFAPPAPLGSSAYMHPEKCTESVPMGPSSH